MRVSSILRTCVCVCVCVCECAGALFLVTKSLTTVMTQINPFSEKGLGLVARGSVWGVFSQSAAAFGTSLEEMGATEFLAVGGGFVRSTFVWLLPVERHRCVRTKGKGRITPTDKHSCLHSLRFQMSFDCCQKPYILRVLKR